MYLTRFDILNNFIETWDCELSPILLLVALFVIVRIANYLTQTEAPATSVKWLQFIQNYFHLKKKSSLVHVERL